MKREPPPCSFHTPLTPGTPVIDALNPASETDLLRFTASGGSGGDQFFFDVQAKSGAPGARWRLIDPYGNILFNTGFTSIGSDVDTLTLAQPGSYTLLVEGRIVDTGSTTYTINVQPVPNPNSQALTLGSVTSGSISDIASTIANAVEQQSSATQEIAKSVQNVAQGTQEAVASVMQVNRGATETGTASEEVLNSARTLSSESTRLREELDRFMANIRAA